MIFEERRGEFLISTDRARIDVDAVHGFLTHSYWAGGFLARLLEVVNSEQSEVLEAGIILSKCGRFGYVLLTLNHDFSAYQPPIHCRKRET